MKVLFLDPVEERLGDMPERYLAPAHEVLRTTPDGQRPAGWESADAVVWWDTPVDAALIGQFADLKLMQRVGWFRAKGNATAALDRNIPVAVTPFGVSDRVAQHGFTLTMMLLRRMHVAIDALERRLNPEELQELPADTPGQNTINWARLTDIQSLNDKTIGILGFGEIGSCYAHMLSPFHNRVLVNRRRPLTPQQEAFYGVKYAEMDELLRESDVVVSFVPGIPEAAKMMGAAQFALMKPSAYFVNCGRARTVDDDALLAALKENRIAGAGIDVFAVEPLPRNSEYRELPNAILTPHSAGGPAGWTDTFARLRMNLDRVAAGRGDEVVIRMTKSDPQPE